MKKSALIIFALLLTFTFAFADAALARGGRSGGSRSGGFRSSTSRSTTSKSTTSRSTTSKSTTSTRTTRPSSSTKTVTATAPKTVAGKTYSKGYVVDKNYQPRFSGGYRAPAGSVVYYRDSSMWDWFPLYYIMTHNSQREAVVKEPNGKETVVKEEGTDGMYIFNWIMLIAMAGGLIWLIVWFVNKKTSKPSRSRYSY